MYSESELTELKAALKSGSGGDYLDSLDLLQAEFTTRGMLYTLRKNCLEHLAEAEKLLEVELCVLAFGSLGRYEFIPQYSDLDPLIIFKKKDKPPPEPNFIRATVLLPILKANSWLKLDDREKVLKEAWQGISNPDLRYPVYDASNLTFNSPDRLTQQRCWQLLLEATPLYGPTIFDELRQTITPKRVSQGNTVRTDFEKLFRGAPEFFSGFENPKFLYKSPFNYWKTRFLRDFYVFSNAMNIYLASFLDPDGHTLTAKFFGGSNTLKIIRLTQFADKLDQSLANYSALRDQYIKYIDTVLKTYKINPAAISRFGNAYRTEARMLHGLIANLLSRFSLCWSAVYDGHVRSKLSELPISDANFDAQFPATIADPDVQAVVRDLLGKRNTYLRYMAATADVIQWAFVGGSLWHTSVQNGSPTLQSFISAGKAAVLR